MSKYKNKWTKCLQGHSHQSKKEARRCNELSMIEKNGNIKWLKQQPTFTLQPTFKYRGKTIRKITYRADFSYFDTENKMFTVEDVKGFSTNVYRIKKKILLFTMRDRQDFRFLET